MLSELQDKCINYANHIAGLCQISCSVIDTLQQQFVYTKGLMCDSCTHFCCSKIQTHLYGCNEAYRWNGKYIYYCPLGLVFVASPISGDTGDMVGGIVAGPLVMGDFQDTLDELSNAEMKEKVACLPRFSTTQVNHLAEIMAATTAFSSGMPHSIMGTFVYEQEKMLNALYEMKNQLPSDSENSRQIIESEKQLSSLIIDRDKSGAQKLLNELLGQIYFSSDFNLDCIKARILELIVIISHATIDAGADMNEILLYNTNYIKMLEQFASIEELSVWVTGIMHRFISYSFDFTQVKHSNVVYKVMEYVKSHYDQKISLDDIAQNVYLSRTYLSSIFKEETGQSLYTYINNLRVEKSKRYLLDDAIKLVDIAGLCGFEDQSYFTKVFKRTTGESPKKFRDSQGHFQNNL